MISFRSGAILPRCSSSSYTYPPASLRRIRLPYRRDSTSKHGRQLGSCSKIQTRGRHQRQTGLSSRAVENGITRPRISGGQRPQCASFWSRRTQSSWHRPGCKWVRSEGDPRQVPRDNDCPACQEEASRPTELSHRELIWQRQVQFMREFLERDPYNALFGRSNDRLRGYIPGSFWHETLRRPWSTKAWELLHQPKLNAEKQTRDSPIWTPRPQTIDSQTTAEATKSGSSITKATEASATANESKERSSPSQTGTNETPNSMHSYGRWRLRTTDSSGRMSEESGEMVYDPITMRMIRSSEVETEQIQSKVAPDKETLSPIKMPGTNGKVSKQSNNKDLVSPSGSSTGMTIPERRLALIRKVEQELSLATSQLKALVALHISNSKNPYKMATVGSALTSLRNTQMALQTLKDSAPIDPISAKKDQATGKIVGTSNSGQDLFSSTSETESKLPIKDALEKSWLKEKMITQMEDHSLTSDSITNNLSRAHFRQAPQISDPEARAAYKTMVGRQHALKHLTAHELGLHRAALLKSWAKKHDSVTKGPTLAEKKLDEEIQAQKLAMTAFENKWRNGESQASNSEPPSASDMNLLSGQLPPTGSIAAEGDMCPNVANFTHAGRWYKRKARHALMSDEHQRQDRALVSEIKQIYEESYGVIDEKHRQGKATETASVSKESDRPKGSSTAPMQSQALENGSKWQAVADRTMYQILAYDPSTQSIHTAKASSSFSPPTGDKILSIPDALARLHHPAKFLSYLTKHQMEGYEIVSANKNLLVLKRVRPSTAPLSKTDFDTRGSTFSESRLTPSLKRPSSSRSANPVDGTSFIHPISPPKTSTGNFASPTGFVNHDVYDEPSKPSSTPSRDNPRVRKEEAVFTGQPSKRFSKNNSQPLGSNNGGYRPPKISSRNIFWISFFAWSVAAWTIVSCGSYIVGWWVEQSEESTTPPDEASAMEAMRPPKPAPAADGTAESRERPGFWAAVNREQSRRAEAAEVKAELQRMKTAESQLLLRQEEANKKLSAIVSAGVDVAVFGTLLWVFIKFLEASGR